MESVPFYHSVVFPVSHLLSTKYTSASGGMAIKQLGSGSQLSGHSSQKQSCVQRARLDVLSYGMQARPVMMVPRFGVGVGVGSLRSTAPTWTKWSFSPTIRSFCDWLFQTSHWWYKGSTSPSHSYAHRWGSRWKAGSDSVGLGQAWESAFQTSSQVILWAEKVQSMEVRFISNPFFYETNLWRVSWCLASLGSQARESLGAFSSDPDNEESLAICENHLKLCFSR